MDTYEKYFNLEEIKIILDNVNEIYKDSMLACHGRAHTMSVVDVTEYILKSLSYNSRIIEFGKIAALLHDIGRIAGRANHAEKSAALAQIILDKSDFSTEERSMIIQAIKDHSKAENISSAIGAAIYIADKIDITKSRILPLGIIDPWHKNLLEIKGVKINISSNEITVDYITTDAFSKELLLSEYDKKIEMIVKAAAYLGCSCEVRFRSK